MADLEKLMAELSELTVLEASELVKKIKEKSYEKSRLNIQVRQN